MLSEELEAGSSKLVVIFFLPLYKWACLPADVYSIILPVSNHIFENVVRDFFLQLPFCLYNSQMKSGVASINIMCGQGC